MLHKSSLVGFFVLGCFGLLLAQNPAAGKHYAFMVACGEYDNEKEFGKLPYTIREMLEFRDVLVASGEYTEATIKVLHNDVKEARFRPRKKRILDELDILLNRLNEEDTLLVVFNGHGIQPKDDPSAYFCPIDAAVDDKKTCIALEGKDGIFERLKGTTLKRKLLIVNACRDDPLGKPTMAARKVDLFDKKHKYDAPTGIAALFSCQPGQFSYYYPDEKETKGRQRSLFFHHLIEGWQGKYTTAKQINLEDVFREVKDRTSVDADKLFGDSQVPFMKREYEREWTIPRRVTTASADENATEERKGGELREVEIASGVKMKFCWIPAGEAQLGSPKEEQEYLVKTQFDGKRPDWLDGENESARGKYKSKGFWLAKYPVTQGEWKAVMGNAPSQFSGDRLPVEQVCWFDGAEFCIKVSAKMGLSARYKLSAVERNTDGTIKTATVEIESNSKGPRLPLEDEWEYACRGGLGNKRAFYWGDALNGDRANCDGNYPYGTETMGAYLKKTSDVGAYESKAKHPWGLCDMSGNVYQWCESLYSEKGSDRVFRGGSWYVNAWDCRSAYRFRVGPSDRRDDVGFRLAVPEPGK